MNFKKRAAAALLAAGMFFSTPAVSIFAESDVAPMSNGVVIEEEIPYPAYPNQDIEAGSMTKQVGENGFYQRVPRSTSLCPNCRRVAVEYVPDVYTGLSYTLSDESILTDCSFDIEGYRGEGGYNGIPCLTFNYKAVHAGQTEVNLTLYYNFHQVAEVGYCDYCGNFISVPRNYNWYKDTIHFTVIVPENDEETYTVTYTDGVTGETVFPDQSYEGLKENDATPSFVGTPTREGYTFMGWAPTVAPTVTEDVVYTATWQKNSPVDPDNPDDPNKKISRPALDKKVIHKGISYDQTDVVEPGDDVTFQLNSNVPTNLFDFMSNHREDEQGKMIVDGSYLLTFHDVIAGQWTDPVNVKVKLKGEVLDSTYYSTDIDDECDLHVTVDLISLFNEGLITEADIRNAVSISVEYDSKLIENPVAAGHSNTAWVTYPNEKKEDEFFESEVDIVTVDVFGIEIIKKDAASGKMLPGAVFTLTDADGNVLKEGVTTEADGTVTVDGLKPGTYYLKETAAPEGYVRISAPIKVVVDLEKTGPDHRIEATIENAAVPETGGMGTTLFTAGGAALLAAATVILTVRKREHAE